MFLRQLRQHAGTNGARGVASESGMQRGRRGTRTADGGNFVDRHVGVLARERMPLSISDENLRQRPDLHGLAVETRSFHPGIFLVAIPSGESRLGLSLP